MIRKGRAYSIEEVFEKIPDYWEPRDKRKVKFDGDPIKVNSLRLVTFKVTGPRCPMCGIAGVAFYKEKHSKKDNCYHFNLYGYDCYGNEILMTKDHIFPKSMGGSETLKNMQTMCQPCNQFKGTMCMKEDRGQCAATVTNTVNAVRLVYP